MSNRTEIIPAQDITPLIRSIRDQRVILDTDLALLYGVETRALVQAVKRNADRFPEDFLFRLTPAEAAALRSQIVISKTGRGGRRYPPYAFTEHGALMAATVLNSPRALVKTPSPTAPSERRVHSSSHFCFRLSAFQACPLSPGFSFLQRRSHAKASQRSKFQRSPLRLPHPESCRNFVQTPIWLTPAMGAYRRLLYSGSI
jgi:hypothetical protein